MCFVVMRDQMMRGEVRSRSWRGGSKFAPGKPPVPSRVKLFAEMEAVEIVGGTGLAMLE